MRPASLNSRSSNVTATAVSSSTSPAMSGSTSPRRPASPQGNTRARSAQRSASADLSVRDAYETDADADRRDGEPEAAELEGIKAPAVIRPEPLSRSKLRVIDVHHDPYKPKLANGVRETEYEHIQLFCLSDLFKDRNQVFVALGRPNVYTVIPNEQGDGYDKFAAFMFFREAARLQQTKDRVQSGFLLRFRGLPPDAVPALREAMQAQAGKTHISCAVANRHVLRDAGFTKANGQPLEARFRPTTFFSSLITSARDQGLAFRGTKIECDLIRTAPAPLLDHLAEASAREWNAPCRAVDKSCTTAAKPPILLPAQWTETPSSAGGADAAKVKLCMSQPSDFGLFLRSLWGAHILWSAEPASDHVRIDDYLPEKLREFPQTNPSLFTRLKHSLFTPTNVEWMRGRMAKTWSDAEVCSPLALADIIPESTPDKDRKYNIVITGEQVLGEQLEVQNGLIDWVLSKHVLISGYSEDVRFAGEAWLLHTEKGPVLHLNNNSGTYMPSNEQLEKAAEYLRKVLPGVQVVTHPCS